MKKILMFFLLFGSVSGYGQKEGTYQLLAKLHRYAFSFNRYDQQRIPLLLGNTKMGSLADPFGRGMYETMFSDVWYGPEERRGLPGLMLESSRFSSAAPEKYSQDLDISNGVLHTRVQYSPAYAYESQLFYSMEDKHRFILKMKNNGTKPIEWYLRLPYEGFTLTDSAAENDGYFITAFNDTVAFTKIAWSLQASGRCEQVHYGHLKYTLPAGDSVVFIYTVYTQFDGAAYRQDCSRRAIPDFEKWKTTNTAAWNRIWQNTAAIILPEAEPYASRFYRSLFWMYAVAGADKFPSSEVQFANLTSPMAVAYGYYSDSVRLDVMNWQMHSFTYGTSGWAALAMTLLGNQPVSRNILKMFYQPDALRWNATHMFPIGKAHVYNKYGSHEYKGENVYLTKDNPLMLCYGHELDYRLRDISYPPSGTVHWDWQLHLDGFIAAAYTRYVEYFNDTAFLRATAYPLIRGIAEFFSEFLHYDPQKKAFVLPPTLSLAEDYFKPSPIESMLAAKWVMEKAAFFADRLGSDKALSDKWKAIAGKVYIPQDKWHYLEWDGDDFTREGGGYEGIRGFSYFGFPTTEYIDRLDKAKMRRTLDAAWLRNKKGEGIVAYSVNWFALSEIYLHNISLAMEMLHYSLSQWDPSGTAYMEVVPQKAYYHPTGISYLLAITTMALQSVNDRIDVFAAVPPEWKDMELYDLPASYGIRVSASLKDGKVQWVSYKLDGKELLRLQEKRTVKIIHAGGGISLLPI